MTALKNHSGFWLRSDAAAQFDAYEAKYGKIRVSSAGRYVADQQKLINRYDKGGPANRPPNLYPPARPASASNHVRNGGAAVDTPDWRIFERHCEEFGFKHSYPDGDPVHFDFIGAPHHAPAPAPHHGSVSNPFGISDVRGLQKIANLYGAHTVIDNVWGPKSAKGFATFLRKNYGYSGNDAIGSAMWVSIDRWLTAKWGYRGNSIPGPIMRAHLKAANASNFKSL